MQLEFGEHKERQKRSRTPVADRLMFGFDDDSDSSLSDEIEDDIAVRCASERHDRPVQPRARRRYVDRDFAEGYSRLLKDYFGDHPRYTDTQFRQRFRIRRALFDRILKNVVDHDPWFKQRPSRAGKLGFTELQKVCAALRQLAYGGASDQVQ